MPGFSGVKTALFMLGETIWEIAFVAPPLTALMLHVPTPCDGMFAASVAEPVMQMLWSGPASDAEVAGTRVIETWSDVLVQPALEVVHSKIYVPVAVMLVMADVGDEGVVIPGVAGPLIKPQDPVPTEGVFPAKVPVAAQTF